MGQAMAGRFLWAQSHPDLNTLKRLASTKFIKGGILIKDALIVTPIIREPRMGQETDDPSGSETTHCLIRKYTKCVWGSNCDRRVQCDILERRSRGNDLHVGHVLTGHRSLSHIMRLGQ